MRAAPGSDRSLCWAPARRLAAAIADGRLTATELLEACLAQIDAINPQVNAIVTLDAERARAEARAADEAVRRGRPVGPLHGLPTAVKDLEDTAGMRTTYGSPLYRDHVPRRDSLVAERLRRAGAIVIGKTNTPEFGAGSQTFNEVFGATRNPFDLTRTAGGSSGGAAVAVACGMVPLADGSDLAASVRNPAAFASVVGLRPSPGRIPSATAAGDPWESLSVIGPIARSIDDAALLLAALAGRDGRDPRSVPAPESLSRPIAAPRPSTLRIAWSDRLGDLPVEPVVSATLAAARARLARGGISVDDAEPDLAAADEVFDVLRAVGFASAYSDLYETRADRLKDTVRWNVRRGLELRGPEIGRALALRAPIFHAMREFLEHYDALALPTTQVAPFDVERPWVEEIDGTAMEHYVAWLRSCSRITVTGHPAVSIPAGLTPDGLPIGLQLVGRHQDERRLLEVAAAVAEAIGADHRPPLAQP